MVDRIKKRFAIIFFIIVIIIFYAPFLFSIATKDLKVPLPADTIVGLYSPYRDFYAHLYPNGIPFKNFLITDPVRQTYIWKELAMEQWAKFQVPSWNPYEMAGKPLAGNLQSGVFYPLNLFLLISPFPVAWSFFIILQSTMAGIFTYLYLRNQNLHSTTSFVGALAFTFSGFSVSWLEWGSVLHSAVWLPLILLVIDKAFLEKGYLNYRLLKKVKHSSIWFVAITLLLSASLFGGHLQTFFYLFFVTAGYFTMRWFLNGRKKEIAGKYLLAITAFVVITVVQWFPTLRFILLSARSMDQNFQQTEGWFLPFEHLIQFFVPDFFGNPATLNYWGTWNYGELTGYVGIVSILFVFYSLFKRNSTVLFFAITLIVSFILILQNPLSSLPYALSLPFISSSQPTRLLFLISFSLSILSAYGAEFILTHSKLRLKMLFPLLLIFTFFISLWVLVEVGPSSFFGEEKNIQIAKRNLILPTLLFIITSCLLSVVFFVKKSMLRHVLMIGIITLFVFDLLRFAQKFTPFVSVEYIFPKTEIIDYLKKDKGVFRTAVMDRRIMPPNFFTNYRIQTIEGYDPLYLKSYAEYITALERNKADLSQPFGFNRIITPHNYDSELFNFLNTKYVLSYDEINLPHFSKVFQEGQTIVYENKKAYERAFFVENVVKSKNVIGELFVQDLKKTAVIDENENIKIEKLSPGIAKIEKYSENRVVIETSNDGDGFLVLSDTYYPTWKVFINGIEGKLIKTDHAFRGVYLPKGNHTIIFKDSLF